jgi:uncharacterized repeat protein (TIGR04052 family)
MESLERNFMKVTVQRLAVALLFTLPAMAQTQPVSISFKAVVGSEDFACGRSYPGIGTTKSTIKPKDFRLYVHNVRLVDEKGKEVPVQLTQFGRWQLDNVALLDFESGSGGCINGNPDINTDIVGTVPSGHTYHGLRFVLGVPFDKNHTDLTEMHSPLDLTALAWSWNGGRKFARIEFASTGRPRGYVFHLGSTGCRPNSDKTSPPTACAQANRPEIAFDDFEPASSVVLADLAALLKDSNVDVTPEKYKSGCMSTVENPDCAPLFANIGLPFAGHPAKQQTFFRLNTSHNGVTSSQQ